MDFFEFHKNILKDNFFEEYLGRKMLAKVKKIKKGHSIGVDKVAIVKSGIFICVEPAIILTKGDYIYSQHSELVAIESGEIQEFNTVELISFLENEDLLSNFYFILVNQCYKKIRFLNTMSSYPSRRRVQYLLERINKYSKNQISIQEIGISQIARLCNCSLNTVKKMEF